MMERFIGDTKFSEGKNVDKNEILWAFCGPTDYLMISVFVILCEKKRSEK